MDERDLRGVLESEFESLKGLSKQDVITWLMEGFSVSRDKAVEAVNSIGAWR